ncbi:1-aminocyclopropane-1-carboxylate deaminase/D-cysteine desulfhydrase [Syntrophomonas zehnderi OL-4]|uniref:1-aminocyclopropane-1-carboxylate deaminase/D-cysteine desulfhydrase n=1 Tax=Syntrophomonas zehnderi OL-4 TaxID=690567 RepID=A0A0E4GBT3_9FIRM|nr:D-cysteine desulfhydrase family protein [Syntrophomonas zehnderi]CFX81532.1 1-aminocyclopropane-1-carboxylate deaminase/D-cysteine desulfhydrase [Syntrophomonas zehnderi OL-4]
MLSELERIHLGEFPTPLHELKNLSSYLKGPRIYIKRDDLTGLALGGNKVRKLEYILADALAQKAEVIITIGAVSSNHARQTAAAAAVLGLECQLVLIGPEPEQMQGNYLLDHLLGADCYCVRNRDVETAVARLIEENHRRGKVSYVIPAGGHTPLGAIAYMQAYSEIKAQSPQDFAAVVTAVGTGTTYAGLHLGQKNNPDDTRVIGISVGGDLAWCHREILKVVNEVEEQLEWTASRPEDFNIFTDYIGEGYTIVYPRVQEVIKLLARKEGVLLDPVYTGKAMVGLIDLITKGFFRPDQNVLFLHTGGTPELFSL